MTGKKQIGKGFIGFICILLTFSFFAGCTRSFIQNDSSSSVLSSSTSTEIYEPAGTLDYSEIPLPEAEVTTAVVESTVKQLITLTETETESKTTKAVTISETVTEDTATLSDENNPRLIDKIKKISDKNKSPKLRGEEFFNDAVFVGDSVTMGLRNYVTNQRNNGSACLGTAKFLCAGSMGWGNTLKPIGSPNSIHPKYQGKEVTVADGIKLIGANKVFIMLGINDIAAYSDKTTLDHINTLIAQIKDKCPSVKIYIESITPIIASMEKGRLTNSCIDELNKSIKELCKENGWTYVDVASCLKNSNNCLEDKYCSDPNSQGIHMAYSGCKQWIDYLITHF